MIVGGIIGSVISESKHQKEKQALANNSRRYENESIGKSSELVDGYVIEETYTQQIYDGDDEISGSEPQVQWYQTGKDCNCYLMGIDKGVTDVISAAFASRCL